MDIGPAVRFGCVGMALVVSIMLSTKDDLRNVGGCTVYLPHNCKADDPAFDNYNRKVVVQLRSDGKILINSTEFRREDLPATMATIMATRPEAVVTLIADPQLAYGEVVSVASGMKAKVHRLVILLPSPSQLEKQFPSFCLSSKDVAEIDRQTTN
jgi:biopolymer transport protein ExbD